MRIFVRFQEASLKRFSQILFDDILQLVCCKIFIKNNLIWKALRIPSDSTRVNLSYIKDPFWDEVEDYAIGSSSAFLQSLSYGLDFEDKLALTDHRGTEQGQLSIVLTPCEKNGKPLGEDHFVEDPQDLLNKRESTVINLQYYLEIFSAYYVKVDIRSGEVYNSRFTHGLYVKYGCTFAGEQKDHHKSEETSRIVTRFAYFWTFTHLFIWPISCYYKMLGRSVVKTLTCLDRWVTNIAQMKILHNNWPIFISDLY